MRRNGPELQKCKTIGPDTNDVLIMSTDVERSRPRLRFTDICLDTLQEPASLDCSENTKANCQWLSAKCLFPVAPALLPLKYEVLVFVPRHSADDLDKGLLWLSAEC